MSDQKTRPTRKSVAKFLAGLQDPRRREESQRLVKLLERVTGEKAVLWGESLIGFGRYRYRYASGREGECFLTGFSPRKQALSVYVMSGLEGFGGLLKKLGPVKTGKACLYIKRLEDVDLKVLEKLVRQSVAQLKKTLAK